MLCGVKTTRPIFKTEMLIHQSKATVDEKILFGNINHQLDPEIRKLPVKGKFGNMDSLFNSGG